MLNQCTLVGKIKVMPHEVLDPKGNEHMVLILAVERPFRDENGIYKIDDIPVEVWAGVAESTKEICTPGAVIGLKGRLQFGQFKDEINGIETHLQVIAEKISFLSSRILAEARINPKS